MRIKDQRIHLSATDLANHLGCQHLTQLNRAVAEGRREVSDWHDPMLEILAARGEHHEKPFSVVNTNQFMPLSPEFSYALKDRARP